MPKPFSQDGINQLTSTLIGAAIHLRQLRTYARLADCPVGLLLNFGAPVMKDGIKRILNGFPTQ